MQKFHMDFFADAAGMHYYNLCLRALNDKLVISMYEYKVEYDLATDQHYTGKMHRITWWRRREQGEQR